MNDRIVTSSLPAKGVFVDMVVEEILARWPETARVFQQFKTACVGCAMAPFDTAADIIRIYELNGEAFLQALQQAAGNAPKTATDSEEK